MRRARAGTNANRDDDQAKAESKYPTTGLWQTVRALSRFIDASETAHHKELKIPENAAVLFRASETAQSLAYWQWCVRATMPTSSVLKTPLGTMALDLGEPSQEAIDRQIVHRVYETIGAGCTESGAERSVAETALVAHAVLNDALPRGTVTVDNLADVVKDLLAASRIERSNLPLATGCSKTFVEQCLVGDGRLLKNLEATWAVASRLGCQATIVCGQRTYVVVPHERPLPQLIASVAEQFATKDPFPAHMTDQAQRYIAQMERGIAVPQIAEAEGVTRQYVSAVLARNTGMSVKAIDRAIVQRPARAMLASLLKRAA